jgi:hypothetical protein
MDRDEALKLLKGRTEGIDEWDQRRRAGEAIPDLSDADFSDAVLSRADLFGAILNRANFEHADLTQTNLSRAELRDADLRSADLTMANLSGANLSGANLTMADLFHANLSEANLSRANVIDANLIEASLNGANLSKADLNGANLSGAYLYEANASQAHLGEAYLGEAHCMFTALNDVDLSEVKGLGTVIHEGPSFISIDTLFKSKGKIPEVFLRGCGVPDILIVQEKALVGSLEPIQFYSCFISYSTKNQDFADRLHSKMRDKRLRVWYSPEDIQGGKKLHEQIDDAIRVYDKLLLVLAPESMNSEWVKTEIQRARKAEKREGRRKLFPIRIVDFETIKAWECFDADSGKDLGVEIREYFIPDFSNWKDHDSFETAFARLLRDLKSEESTGAKDD